MEWLSFQRAVWIFARWVETQIYGASKFILCIGGTTSNSFLPRFFSEAKFAACTIKCTIKWEVGRSSNVWWKIHPLQVIHSYFKVLLTNRWGCWGQVGLRNGIILVSDLFARMTSTQTEHTTHSTSLQKEQMFAFIIITSLLWFVSKKPFTD